MPETHPPAGPSNPDVRHEKGDIDVRTVLWSGGVLAAVALAVHLGLALQFHLLRVADDRADRKLPPLAAQERPRSSVQFVDRIPEPRLQVNDTADLKALRDKETAQLTTYGVVDAKTQKVRIPVADAMKILADPKLAAAHGIRARTQAEYDKMKAQEQARPGKSVPAGKGAK